MNVPLDSISPQLWAAKTGGGGVELHIACGKRFGYVPPPLGAPPTAGMVIAPITLRLSPCDGFTFPAGWVSSPTPIDFPLVSVGVQTRTRLHGSWYSSKLEARDGDGPVQYLIGISNKGARIALREAYRAVQSAVVDFSNMSLKTKFNTKLLREYDGGTPLRNLMTCLLWDVAARNGDPAEILSGVKGPGGACWEGRALSEFAAKVGLR